MTFAAIIWTGPILSRTTTTILSMSQPSRTRQLSRPRILFGHGGGTMHSVKSHIHPVSEG